MFFITMRYFYLYSWSNNQNETCTNVRQKQKQSKAFKSIIQFKISSKHPQHLKRFNLFLAPQKILPYAATS